MPRTPRYVPEDWTAIRAAVYAWASAASGLPTIWKHPSAPAPTKSYVSIGTLTGPRPIGQTSQESSVAIVVGTVAPSTLYRVTIEGVNYDFTSDASPTAAEIAAGLVATLPLATGAQVSTAFGAATVVLLPDLEDGDEIGVSANLAARIAVSQIGDGEWTVSVDVHSDGMETAPPVAIGLARSLQDELFLEALREAGVSVRTVEGVRRPLLTRNGAWEDRAGFDVRFGVATRTRTLIDWIEIIGEITGTYDGGAP